MGWQVVVDFGVSRADGPYLVTADHEDVIPGLSTSTPEVILGAFVGLATTTATEIDPCARDPVDPDDPEPLRGFDSDRCVLGELGFLFVTLRDGNRPDDADDTNDPTNVSLRAEVDLVSDGNDRLTFADLLAGNVDVDFNLGASANVDVRFRTGLNLPGDTGPEFPSVLGRFHLAWSFDINSDPSTSTPDALKFDALHLDAGRFLSDLLGPTAKEVKRIISPFKPFIDFIQAPIPVISDVSELAGGPPITLIDIVEAASDQDLSMIRSVLEVIQFVADLPVSDSGLFIPLSASLTHGFHVDPVQAREGPLTPDRAGDIISNIDSAATNLLAAIATETGSNPNPQTTSDGRPETFGVSGLSFPFLNSASEIFKILMGEDVTLVRYEAGPLRAQAGFEYCAPPIIIVVVPVEICFGGSVELLGRFAMGYDTRGFRQLVGEDGSAGDLLDGIFLDDLDANGNDVPEFTVVGTVYASGAASLYIIKVGVRAGLEATVDFNLDDRPDPDGKLYIEEIVDKLANPICLFVVSGRVEAFLLAFVEIDLFLFSKEFTIEIVRVTLLEFSGACDPPNPEPATVIVVAGVGDGAADLRINIGPHKAARNFQQDEDEEAVIVRQLTAEGAISGSKTRFSVSMFGFYKEYDVPVNGKVFADGGGDADEIHLLSGADQNDNEIPFTVDAVIHGGPGNDNIKTAKGNDIITGGNGNDKIDSGDGCDSVEGNAGNDSINLGLGSDKPGAGCSNGGARGGSGDDIINGSLGDDRLEGGPDNDVLNGGPGVAPRDSAETGGQCGNGVDDDGDGVVDDGCSDGNDTIIGNSGGDSITGGTGDDKLFGDEPLGCDDQSGGTDRRDSIEGGEGIDELFGGPDNDRLVGNEGNDKLCGNAGNDLLDGDDDDPARPDGDDELHGGDGDDKLFGRDGHDMLFGDSGSGNDLLFGGLGPDDLIGGLGRDILHGEEGNDILLGDEGTIIPTSHGAAAHVGGKDNSVIALVTVSTSSDAGVAVNCDFITPGAGNADCLFGAEGDDYLFGEAGADQMFGGDGEDYMEGNTGIDFIRGGKQNDEMHGNAGPDTMHGDSGDDVMFGEGNVDTMRGGIGDDRMVGGSSTAGTPDAGDIMKGDAGLDWMAGDNAKLVTVDGELRIALLDLFFAGDTVVPGVSGGDDMQGNGQNDVMYGQGGNDTMHGNDGDDYMEGNTGKDTMFGDANDDDMVGGSGHDNGGPSGAFRELPNVLDDNVGDAGDTIRGGDGVDFMAGDNASITRTNPRLIKLLDVPFLGQPLPSGGVSGDDTMNGNDGDDVMYGQGDNDTMHGNDGDDYMEGNSGADTMFGDANDDDMVGGSGHDNGGDTGPDFFRELPNVLDDSVGGFGDTMHGGDGVDFMGGDNASITRNNPRIIELLDVPFADGPAIITQASGDDTMNGNAGADVMYGQGDDDTMHGNEGDDYMEGNSGADSMFGDAGEDDMIGGSGHDHLDGVFRELRNVLDEGDTMSGDAQVDYMLGDNGNLTRPGGTHTFNGSVKRFVELYDVQLLSGAAVDTSVSGGDNMSGGSADDVMFGQGDDDTMHGNGGDDYMEGNHAGDSMSGDTGQDDMTGGGSTNDGVITTSSGDFDASRVADGLLDGDDTMTGESDQLPGATDGSGADVMLGDNGVITRPLTAGLWTQNSFNAPNVNRIVTIADVETAANLPLSGALGGDDQMWGNSNDDIMYGQGGMDVMHGGAGHDYMEGNADSDVMFGNSDEDDMLGGTGPTTSSSQLGELSAEDRATALPGRTDESTKTRNVLFGTGTSADPLPTALVPLGDEMHGGPGADVMMGDNGIIIRPFTTGGEWTTLPYVELTDSNGHLAPRHPTRATVERFDRTAEMIDSAPGPVAGSDLMFGDDDDDDMYGQFDNTGLAFPAIGDEMHGGQGEDAMAGDQGVFDNRVVTTATQHIEPKEPFIDDNIFIQGTLYREFHLEQIPTGGDDRMRGGDDGDWMHGGAGEDVMNGDDGNDDIWGGRNHDHVWGGNGFDQLDLHPRVEEAEGDDANCTPLDPPDPAAWYEFGFEGGLLTPTCDGNFEDVDYIYGAWDADAMQADVGDNGPRIGDRLIDWVGVYNLYVLCPATYGEFVSTREFSPGMREFLHRLAEGDGAFDPGPESRGVTADPSGFNEIAFVYYKDIRLNANPPYEGTPAHFNCTVDSVRVP